MITDRSFQKQIHKDSLLFFTPGETHLAFGLSAITLVQLLNIAWITSFDKNYPTIHKWWIVKEVILLYFLVAAAFYYTAVNWNIALFIPVMMIIAQYILWRAYKESKSNSNCDATVPLRI